jgi:hypothetical protein
MEQEYLIPLDKVKQITGAGTDAEAAAQINAVQEMIEAYLAVTLIKTDYTDEKITLPYGWQSVLRPRFAPINSVAQINFLKADGEYAPYQGHYAVGKISVELLCGQHPGHIAAAQISYNAGLYDNFSQAPALLSQAAEKLLAWNANPDALNGFASEHLGDYSYTKGAMVRGVPEIIAGMLDGVKI